MGPLINYLTRDYALRTHTPYSVSEFIFPDCQLAGKRNHFLNFKSTRGVILTGHFDYFFLLDFVVNPYTTNICEQKRDGEGNHVTFVTNRPFERAKVTP